jgi:chemotaxis protein MotB
VGQSGNAFSLESVARLVFGLGLGFFDRLRRGSEVPSPKMNCQGINMPFVSMSRLIDPHATTQDQRKTMTEPAKHRLIVVSLLSTTFLTGCVVWQSDYDALQAQNQQLQQQVASDQQQISRLQGAIKYTVNSDLLFAPGSWQMRPQGQQVITNLAKKLAPTQQNHLMVSGYTDNAPIGPGLRQEGVTSNQELSQKRADAVMQYLISQGVKPDLISAQGFGDASPVAPNDSAQGRTQNRRVELSLVGSGS